MKTPRSVLVVCAHPDDEVLGCGGTIARLVSEGADVRILFLADGVGSRDAGALVDGSLGERRRMGDVAAEILGTEAPTYLDFPDNRLDGVTLLDVVQEIERFAGPLRPEMVLTHFPGDLNVDHQVCAQAVVTAFRPTPEQSVRAIYGFEVASSTEWAFGVAGQSFVPNVYFDISLHLPKKLDALGAYIEEMRGFPHARSLEAVAALARWRGATVGVDAAEAFVVLRMVQ